MDIHALGNVKLVSAFSGTLLCCSPVFIYLAYSFEAPVQSAFIVLVMINAILSMINIFILKRYVPQVEAYKYFVTILKIAVSAFIVLLVTEYFASFFNESFLRLLLTGFFSLILQTIIFYFFCLTLSQRHTILNFIKSKIHI